MNEKHAFNFFLDFISEFERDKVALEYKSKNQRKLNSLASCGADWKFIYFE